jgi:hypothetical protein
MILNKLPLFLSLPMCRSLSLQTEGEGEEPKIIRPDGETAWPSINHSILFSAYREGK